MEYQITIPNQQPHTFNGTDAEMWAHVAKHMAHAPSGAVPKIVKLDAPAVTPESAPVAVVTAPATAVPAAVRGQTVDAEGRARSMADLLAAQAAGLAPRRPLYDRGTMVVDLGVENARKSRAAFETMPRVGQATDTFLAAVAAEHRRDRIVPVGSLGMRGDGTIVGDTGANWQIEEQALTQLATRIGIQHPSFLVHAWPELRAVAWNQHVATILGHEKSTCPREHAAATRLRNLAQEVTRVRLRDTAGGQPSIWAALSDRYAACDVDTIARALATSLADLPDARLEITYTGTGATFDVLFHSTVQPERYVAGEFFQAGIRVRTSDAGGGSIVVSLLVYQNLCLNLIVLDVATYVLAKLRHVGNEQALTDRFVNAIGDGKSRLGHFLKAWGFATDQALIAGSTPAMDALRALDEIPTGPVSTDELLTGIFTGLGKAGDVSIGSADLPGLLSAHARDTSGAVQVAPVTRASVVNAITRYAHEGVGLRDALKQIDLEREAGALLVGGRGGKPAPLPYLPAKAS